MTKKFTKIGLITLVLLALLACFRFSYAGTISDAFDALGATLIEGLAGVLLLGIQQFAALIFGALNVLTTGITGADSVDSILSDVLFNKCALTAANFFNFNMRSTKWCNII